MPEPAERLPVLKTYKLYIGGKFPRTESGRYLRAHAVKTGDHLANYCHASRKDFRDAVVAARSATGSWGAASAYLKGQILYRAAEMLEGRAGAMAAELESSTGRTGAECRDEVAATVDRLVYFAGWTDKFGQLAGTVNPVASSHFNFSMPEPTGVVAVVCPDEPALLALGHLLAEVILTGNTAVVLASERYPLAAMTLAETLATSDLPGGVVNILTGRRAELAPGMASHMDVNGIVDASGDPAIATVLRQGAADNLKRVTLRPPETTLAGTPHHILDTVEIKTAWHPIGH